MLRRLTGLAPLLIALPTACASAATPPQDPQQPVSEAPAKGGPASALHAKIIGEWRAMPPPSEARLLQIAQLALADPTDEAAFEKMRPTDEERQHFRNIQRLRKEEPDSRLLAQLRRKVAEIDSIRLTFTADKIISTTPSGTQIDRYRLEEEAGDQLIVLPEGDGPPEGRRVIFRFIDDDHIVYVKGVSQVPFYRAGTSPQASAALSASTSTGGVASPEASVVAMPQKTGDVAFDTCVADYFACMAQMPPEARSAMKDSLDVVRAHMQMAANDPAGRQSFTQACNSTVRMIKSTGLCR